MPDTNSAEDDDADDSSAEGQPQPTTSTTTHNYITPQGYARLKAEFEHLLSSERPKIVEVVAWAASNGDRSENGDYLYGKKRLREIDRRVRFLGKRMEIAQIVDPARQTNCAQVFFGATVTILDEQNQAQTYQIVGVDETDTGSARISWRAPLARALLKGRVGDVVRFQSPLGWREVEISAIEYCSIESPSFAANSAQE
ncbi:MAG: transcription elongation factor GreB [Pseudomonadota bacterium]